LNLFERGYERVKNNNGSEGLKMPQVPCPYPGDKWVNVVRKKECN